MTRHSVRVNLSDCYDLMTSMTRFSYPDTFCTLLIVKVNWTDSTRIEEVLSSHPAVSRTNSLPRFQILSRRINLIRKNKTFSKPLEKRWNN